MSIVTIYTVNCDRLGPRCYHWIGEEASRKMARKVAALDGWVRRLQVGRYVDLCSACKQLPTGAFKG